MSDPIPDDVREWSRRYFATGADGRPTVGQGGEPGSCEEALRKIVAYADRLPKPWCPCDAGRPQDCQPEKWGDAHSPRLPVALIREVIDGKAPHPPARTGAGA